MQSGKYFGLHAVGVKWMEVKSLKSHWLWKGTLDTLNIDVNMLHSWDVGLVLTERFLLGQITSIRYWKDTNYVFQIFCKDIDGLYLLLVYTLSTPSD